MTLLLMTPCRKASPKALSWAVSFSAAIRSRYLIVTVTNARARTATTARTPIISIKENARCLSVFGGRICFHTCPVHRGGCCIELEDSEQARTLSPFLLFG